MVYKINEMTKINKMVSIVIPVFNEEGSLDGLLKAIKDSMDKKSISFEVIFVDDGSSDRSWSVVETLSMSFEEVRGLKLSRNVGQHNAIIAGFENSIGTYVITIDADMQDNTDVIPRIYEKLKSGFDIVGCRRKVRRDSFLRRFLSFVMHYTIRHFTKVGKVSKQEFTDFGCMLRGYRRWIVEKVIKLGGKSVYIPTFAALIGGNFCEIEVEHVSRAKGKSKYGISRLLSLYFDMITDISLLPVQVISLLGILLSFAGFALGVIIFLRRIFIGPEVEGVFTLFAFLFVFTGVLLISVGLIGEYVGRIYKEVNKKPRFIVTERSGFSKGLRIGVFAYSEVGYSCLEQLIRMGEDIVFVVSHKDNNNESIWFRSVSELAHKFNIPLLKPESIEGEKFINVISSFKPDVIFSFYFRRIFSEELLSIPSLGCINLHGSLLPAYRGRAPVNWVIINGEKETGVTFHYMTQKVDAGPIIVQKRIKIENDDTGLSLTRKIASCGAELLEDVVEGLHKQNLRSTTQDESKATYFGKRTPSMGRIDWQWDNEKIYNYVRALTSPFPGAFFVVEDKKCIIWQGEKKKCENREPPGAIIGISKDSVVVKAGSGCFRIIEVEVGGERFTSEGFVKHFKLKKGDSLGG